MSTTCISFNASSSSNGSYVTGCHGGSRRLASSSSSSLHVYVWNTTMSLSLTDSSWPYYRVGFCDPGNKGLPSVQCPRRQDRCGPCHLFQDHFGQGVTGKRRLHQHTRHVLRYYHGELPVLADRSSSADIPLTIAAPGLGISHCGNMGLRLVDRCGSYWSPHV